MLTLQQALFLFLGRILRA